MEIIARDLQCNAVRVSGGDPARLSVAATHAADAGLGVWFSPFPCEMTPAEMEPNFADCADRAEDVRKHCADVVLVTGGELSLFAAGFVPGENAYVRIAAVSSGDPRLWATLAEVPAQVNAFLADTAVDSRSRFGGKVTYGSGMWEEVDWSPFDIVAVDAYRSAEHGPSFREALRRYFRHGKPVAVAEFGCCTYRGAGERGGAGWAIIEPDADPPRLNGDYVRDEGEQVRYLRELLQIFDQVGVDTTFWFTFAGYELPRRKDPRYDLDMASYGLVRILEDERGTTYPDLAWEPKEAFYALAAAYDEDPDRDRALG
jgi:hypothetical protein